VEYFREGRVFVGCETDEDLKYVVDLIGEDSLAAASDYPHADPSKEESLVDSILKPEDLSMKAREKILFENPKRLYNP